MLVGLEVSAAIDTQRSGVGHYVANLTAGLEKRAKLDPELELIYFSNRNRTKQGQEVGTLSQAIYPHNQLPSRLTWMQLNLPLSLARTRPDLCHFPNHLAPVLGKVETPFLATMHDMSVYRCPQHHALKTVAVHRAIMPVVARRARLIVTVSESARQEILHYLKVPAEKIRVVYNGLGWPFTVSVPVQSASAVEELRQRYNLNFPYVLTTGTLEPRKNQARLIRAFSELVRQERLPHHLVLVGSSGWKDKNITAQVQKSGLTGRVHFLGYVPSRDLPDLYRLAEAFAFPSLYEGFGLPVLEAMACGTPSLISTDPALLEVAGKEAAVAVDPYSVPDIAAGLYRLLSETEFVGGLRTRGLARAAEFSWDKCAAQTLALYQEVFDALPRLAINPHSRLVAGLEHRSA